MIFDQRARAVATSITAVAAESATAALAAVTTSVFAPVERLHLYQQNPRLKHNLKVSTIHILFHKLFLTF